MAEAYNIEIDTTEDHVHVFLCAPPRSSPAQVMQIMKSISARELFARFPWLRRKLRGGEFCRDGYFVRTIGDQVTSEIIRWYIRHQKSPQICTVGAVGRRFLKAPQQAAGIFTYLMNHG